MKKTYTLFLVSLLLSMVLYTSSAAQTAELIGSYTTEGIANIAATFQLPPSVYTAEYGVDAYRVTYEMPYLDSTITVSGAMFIPVGTNEDCPLPVITYMHGTIFLRTDAPSFLSFEGSLGYLMSSPGYITLMPDYVGLGTSDLMHPYVHAQTEAEAGVYLLQAAETLGLEMGFAFDDEFYSTGYSQGGHASMAFSRELQENWSDVYPLIASAPLSGPYDISGVQSSLIIEVETYSNPAYLAYNIIGWNSYYGNLYNDLSEIFQEPYATGLPAMFDGETSGAEINAYLPATLTELIQPGLLEEIASNPEHPFNIASQDNDVYQWVPESPINMYYCTEDEQVFYQNAIVAEEWMTANGATNVVTTNGGPLNHGACAGPAIFGGMLWMQSYHEDCVAIGIAEEMGDLVWSIVPNPAVNGTTTLIGLPSDVKWAVKDISGRIIQSGQGVDVHFSNCSEGIYFISTDSWGTQRVLIN
mgnify:FL=1